MPGFTVYGGIQGQYFELYKDYTEILQGLHTYMYIYASSEDSNGTVNGDLGASDGFIAYVNTYMSN